MFHVRYRIKRCDACGREVSLRFVDYHQVSLRYLCYTCFEKMNKKEGK
jgi:hypothetical protein